MHIVFARHGSLVLHDFSPMCLGLVSNLMGLYASPFSVYSAPNVRRIWTLSYLGFSLLVFMYIETRESICEHLIIKVCRFSLLVP